MNTLDIFLLVGLGFGAVAGWRKGFLLTLAGLVSVLLGILVAIHFSDYTESFLARHGFAGQKWIGVIAFVVTFVGVILAMDLLAKVLTKVANLTPLGLVNNVLGAALGILKSILILSIALNLLEKVNAGRDFVSQKTLDGSELYQPTQKVAQWIYPSITAWFRTYRESL